MIDAIFAERDILASCAVLPIFACYAKLTNLLVLPDTAFICAAVRPPAFIAFISFQELYFLTTKLIPAMISKGAAAINKILAVLDKLFCPGSGNTFVSISTSS